MYEFLQWLVFLSICMNSIAGIYFTYVLLRSQARSCVKLALIHDDYFFSSSLI